MILYRKYQSGGLIGKAAIKGAWDLLGKTVNLPEVDIYGKYGYTLVDSENDPKYKAYRDSLKTYNTALQGAKDMADGTAFGYKLERLKDPLKWGMSKKEIENAYKRDRKFYRHTLVSPIITGVPSEFGFIYRDKMNYWTMSNRSAKKVRAQGDIPYYDVLQNTIDSYENQIDTDDYTIGGAYGTKHTAEKNIETLKKYQKLPSYIKPVGVLFSAELPLVPIYKKPTRKVIVRGSEKSKILQKQVKLKGAGLYKGKIDGIWGPKSQAAWDTYMKKPEEGPKKIIPVDDSPEQKVTAPETYSTKTKVTEEKMYAGRDRDGNPIYKTRRTRKKLGK